MKFQHYDVLIGVRISKEMKEKLAQMSLRARLSEGEIIRDAVDKYFKAMDKFGPEIFPLMAGNTPAKRSAGCAPAGQGGQDVT